jgi:PPOX class probable FMN-dependent enzyme
MDWLARIDISIARSRKIRGGNYVQIATVDPEGFPHVRTVVFRGFLKPGSGSKVAMKMITDARSNKVEHLHHSNKCEMVWWFSQSSEQYRVSGELAAVGSSDAADSETGAGAARDQMWKALSDPAREQFYWHPPGQDYAGTPLVPTGGRDADGKILPPPSNFLLLLLIPKAVKYLRLKDNLAMVDTRIDVEESSSTTSSKWTFQRVNP